MFQHIKLDANGQQLPSDATNHVITRDVTLGIDATVRAPGFDKRMKDTEADKAIAKLNADAYLGHSDWRRPAPWELLTQVAYVNEDIMADLSLYPDMKADWYWTNQETPWSSGRVFCVYFGGGCVGLLDRNYEAFVRPVRSVSPGQ